jgi:hypothetical protein
MAKVEECCETCAPLEMQECLDKMLAIAKEYGVHACVVGLSFEDPETYHTLLGYGACLKHQIELARLLGRSTRKARADARV